MLLLTVLSMMDKQNTTFAIILGDIVIIGNDIINLMCLGFLVIKLHIESKVILSFLKKHQVTKSEAFGLWLQLLFVPLQLAHMGFEEMIAFNIASHDPNKRQATFRKGKLGKPRPAYELQNDFDHASFEQSHIDVPDASTDRNRLLRNRSKLFEMELSQNAPVEETIETFGDNPQFSSRIITSPPSKKSRRPRLFDETSPDLIIENGSGPASTNSEALKSPGCEAPKANQMNTALKSGAKGILKNSSSQADPNQNLFSLRNKSQENNLAPFANVLDIASLTSFYDDLDNPRNVNSTSGLSPIAQKGPINSKGKSDSGQSFISNNDNQPGERASSDSANGGNGLPLHMTTSNGSNNPRKKSPFSKDREMNFERENKVKQEKQKGWTRLKRHFNFEDVSGDDHLRDGGMIDKKTRLRGKLPLALWQEGEKLFNRGNDE